MKEKEPNHIKWMNITGILVTVMTIIAAIYIMSHKMGLVEGLEFGAGAYFYADIPEFQKYVTANHYKSSVSMGMLILLFLIWGALMYKAWGWLEDTTKKS